MKRVLTVVLCLVLALSCVGMLSACNNGHTHKFAAEWSSDGTNHWHECTCGEKSDVAAHTEQVVPAVGASCTQTGLTEGKKCSVCDRVLNAQTTVGMLDHDFTGEWKKNENGHWRVCQNEGCDETSTPAQHELNNANRCTVCDYQGKLEFSQVDEATWAAAFGALADITDFTVRKEKFSDGEMEELLFAEIVSNQAHVILYDEWYDMEQYVIYHEVGATVYHKMGGIWTSWFNEELEIQAIIDNSLEDCLTVIGSLQIADSFSEFAFNQETGEYTWEINQNGWGTFTVRFVGNSLYYAHVTLGSVEDGDYYEYTLDKVGNTSFEIEPLHKHKFSTEWSSNNVYHWHEATCHDGEIDVKVAHTWGTDNKCTVCGHSKPDTSIPTVDEETFAKALELKNLSNWSLTCTSDKGMEAYKRAGNVLLIVSEYASQLVEIDEDGAIWLYIEISDGVWEKLDASEYEEIAEYLNYVDFFLYGFDVLADFWDDFTLNTDKYVAEGLEFRLDNFLIGKEFTNATVELVFNYGEVVSIKITEIDNNEEKFTVTLNKLGSTVIDVPNATPHEHSWSWIIYDDEHARECPVCYMWESGDHDYDNDGVCTVCGAMNHEHNFNKWIPSRNDIEWHSLVCEECGVQSTGSDSSRQHIYTEADPDHCVACGAARHTHQWTVTVSGELNYHTLYCSDCGERHAVECEFDGADPDHCSVCGKERHYHQYNVAFCDEIEHDVWCHICNSGTGGYHKWNEENKCEICGYDRHFHSIDNSDQDGESHFGYCEECGNFIQNEKHVWDESNTYCIVCGRAYHTHSFTVDPENNYYYFHYIVCTTCGYSDTEEHRFNSAGICVVCNEPEHKHVYNQWIPNDWNTEYHEMGCECGQFGYVRAKHTFNEHNICEVCGYERHVHTWVIWFISETQHSISCTSCGDSIWDEHKFVGDVCDVCHALNHDHIYDRWAPSSNPNRHIWSCECGVMQGDNIYDALLEPHDIDEETGRCRDCNAEAHEHHIYWFDGDDYTHYGQCHECGEDIYGEHEWGDDEVTCDMCGYIRHVHDFQLYKQDAECHYWRCDCGEEESDYHDFEETDELCSVCQAQNHGHSVDHYIDNSYNYATHFAVCECGVMIEEEHYFGEDDDLETCERCHAERHHHHWVYTHSYDQYAHTVYCPGCGTYDWQDHQFGEDHFCTMCEYEEHEHNYVVEDTDFFGHIKRCTVCQFTEWQEHSFDEDPDVCDDCGAPRHIHEVESWNEFNDDRHQGFCQTEEEWVYEEHSFGDGDICEDCGYSRNN
ncbi:MAG: hypothetical protein J1F68_04710 [Clostridiales bacterium]|nr:hypothetical protein [Clostridiales bacterium]